MLDKIEDAIADIAKGRAVIVVDDEERENEGDFVAAAEAMTPELVNFMVTHGRGMLCAPITEARAHELELDMMVGVNTSLHGTPFTVTIDYLHGTTTCIGSSFPAMDELARKHGVPHVGRDGKTGETLMKTTLAPMFVARNLKVLSWEGYNMLGNRDGKVLDAPDANAAKCKDKDACLRDILDDDETHSRVRIDYVPSLGDWKTAWDFIHFTGFLGTKMMLQFTWQGCDSALASPLVLDLVRLADFAHRANESGNLRHLACFFKAPYEAEQHGFFRQNEKLLEYVAAHRKARVGVASR